MSINKLALIRYKTIDVCLQNRQRKWTLDDLIDAVSEALYDYEGISSGVGKRTIQQDIQLMRSDKLGYNAPIIVLDKKYYTYENKEYSITKAKMNPSDLNKMKDVVALLKHFNGFSFFEEMSEMITRLEDRVISYQEDSSSLIQFETNPLLRGLEYLNPLYQATVRQIPIQIQYQSFKAQTPIESIYHPYLLKEYRNRWFLICKPKKGNTLLTLALDRMHGVKEIPEEKFIPYKGVAFNQYFSDLIGVTKSEKDRAHKVILFVDAKNLPYVITKPLHPSQVLLKEDEQGGIIRLDVILNFELEREILGFGEAMKVMAPAALKKRIQKRIELSLTSNLGIKYS